MPFIECSRPSSLYRADQVAELDQLVMQHQGISAQVLMKRAGRQAFECILTQWPGVSMLHIFCGAGNNGGDGYIVAALAKQRNINVSLWSLAPITADKPAAFAAYQYALDVGVECKTFDENAFIDSQLMQTGTTVIVDALLGTGVRQASALPDAYVTAVRVMNDAKQRNQWPLMALDVPTGVNPDTGEVTSVAIEADVTISFIGQKQGLFTSSGREHSGRRLYSDLEVEHEWLHLVNPSVNIIELETSLEVLPERRLNSHKNHCGHVLVVGGDQGVSYSYGGAPIMAAQMALRAGAGLVSLAMRAKHYVSAALARQPELMAAVIDNGQALLPVLGRASTIVIGPGLGRSAWSEQLLYQTLNDENAAHKPMVIDADALHLLSQDQFASLSSVPLKERQWILTPHPGEAASLLNTSIEQVQSNRFEAARAIGEKYGGAVILKGAGTVVATSTGALWLCDAGNSGMASGGMGDVLSGLLGALLAQGMAVDDAALLGTVMHSTAADMAVETTGRAGLLATDLIPYVQQIMDV